jgi:hypothetical protein
MQKCIKWVKDPLYCKVFLLLGQEILLSGICMKRAMYVLIIWENFGTQSFLHRQESFLSGDVLSRFYCKLKSLLGNSIQ